MGDEGTIVSTVTSNEITMTDQVTTFSTQQFDHAHHRRLTVRDLPSFPSVEELQELYGGKDAVLERIQDDEEKTHTENVNIREEIEREARYVYTTLKQQEWDRSRDIIQENYTRAMTTWKQLQQSRMEEEAKVKKRHGGSAFIPSKPTQSVIMPLVKSFGSKAKVSKKVEVYEGDQQGWNERDTSPTEMSPTSDIVAQHSSKKPILKSMFRSKSVDSSVLGKRVERCRKVLVRDEEVRTILAYGPNNKPVHPHNNNANNKAAAMMPSSSSSSTQHFNQDADHDYFSAAITTTTTNTTKSSQAVQASTVCTTIIPKIATLPKSCSWVKINHNIAAEDEAILRALPYFGDDDVTGVDVSEFEKIPGELEPEICGEAQEMTLTYLIERHRRNNATKPEVYSALENIFDISFSEISKAYDRVLDGPWYRTWIRRELEAAVGGHAEGFASERPSVKLEDVGMHSAMVNLAGSEAASLDFDTPTNIQRGLGCGLGILNTASYSAMTANFHDFFCRRCFKYNCLTHSLMHPLPNKRIDPDPPKKCPIPKLVLPVDMVRIHRRSMPLSKDDIWLTSTLGDMLIPNHSKFEKRALKLAAQRSQQAQGMGSKQSSAAAKSNSGVISFDASKEEQQGGVVDRLSFSKGSVVYRNGTDQHVAVHKIQQFGTCSDVFIRLDVEERLQAQRQPAELSTTQTVTEHSPTPAVGDTAAQLGVGTTSSISTSSSTGIELLPNTPVDSQVPLYRSRLLVPNPQLPHQTLPVKSHALKTEDDSNTTLALSLAHLNLSPSLTEGELTLIRKLYRMFRTYQPCLPYDELYAAYQEGHAAVEKLDFEKARLTQADYIAQCVGTRTAVEVEQVLAVLATTRRKLPPLSRQSSSGTANATPRDQNLTNPSPTAIPQAVADLMLQPVSQPASNAVDLVESDNTTMDVEAGAAPIDLTTFDQDEDRYEAFLMNNYIRLSSGAKSGMRLNKTHKHGNSVHNAAGGNTDSIKRKVIDLVESDDDLPELTESAKKARLEPPPPVMSTPQIDQLPDINTNNMEEELHNNVSEAESEASLDSPRDSEDDDMDHTTPSTTPTADNKKHSASQKSSNSKKNKVVLANKNSFRHAFEPCKHIGPCSRANNCICIVNGTFCEKYCCCDPATCRHQFPGCECKRGACRTKSCPCYAASRSCDPDLCGVCGASIPPTLIPFVQAFMQANQTQMCFAYPKTNPGGNTTEEQMLQNGDNLFKFCANVAFKHRPGKKLLVGRSLIHGWGGYATEKIDKNEFICEYVGEVISQTEAERRGNVYDKQNLSYLFTVNDDQVVDATRKGNRSKFINHNLNPNCFVRIYQIEGDHKIGLFAKRSIRAGEELTFDYNYKNHTAPAWAGANSGGADNAGQKKSNKKS